MTEPEVDAAGAQLLLIKSIDASARLNFSEWTMSWYVESRIEVSDGSILTGVCEHRPTPDEAVSALLDRLKSIDLNEVIVGSSFGSRRHYRWNGAAFAEQYDRRLADFNARSVSA